MLLFKKPTLFLYLAVGGNKTDFTHLNECIYPQEVTKRSIDQPPVGHFSQV